MGKKNKVNKYGGIFGFVASRTKKDRLGDLLIRKNIINKNQLERALSLQKNTGMHIGKILTSLAFVRPSTLYMVLAEQYSYRFLAAIATITISLCALAPIRARADSIKDIPAKIQLASVANNAFSSIKSYPSLFNSTEKKSYNIAPFTKWSDMFTRFEIALNNKNFNESYIQGWKRNLERIKNLPVDTQIKRVNDMMNAVPYISDMDNYGTSDLWADPITFFKKGGDCEDYAIAKYASLRILGIPEERMRIAVVRDEIKNIMHAVLIVYMDNKTYVLDNQIKRTMDAKTLNRYKPIFSINRLSWWLHSKPQPTLIASAR